MRRSRASEAVATLTRIFLVAALTAWSAPIAQAQTVVSPSAPSSQQQPGIVTPLQQVCPECIPPEYSPPEVTIVTPGASTGTRTPVVRITYGPGGFEYADEIRSVAVSWGGTDVTSLGRSNLRVFEWEVPVTYQLSPGTPKTLSVTVCSRADLCTSSSVTTTLPAGNAPILSVTPMPLEALGRVFTSPLGPGYVVSGAEVLTSVGTPAYYSWDSPRTTGLTYSSRQSYPRALVNVDLEFPGGAPTWLRMRLYDGAMVRDEFTQASPTCLSSGQQRCRVSLQAEYLPDTTITLARKWLKVEALATVGGSQYSAVDSVEAVIVNRRSTPYGAGWWPSGVARLFTAGSDAIIVADDGTATVYRGNDLSYLAPPGDHASLVWTGYGWELRFREGGKLVFDSQGRHTASQGANGLWQTTISYADIDRVNRITDPAGKYFQFTYTSGVLSGIQDPGGRVTAATIAGRVLSSWTPQTDSGHNYAQTFAWQTFTGSASLPDWRQNALGHRTTLQYDARWRPTGAVLPQVQNENGSSVQPVIGYQPQDVQGLGAVVSLDSLCVAAVDALGHWTRTRLNRWGQALRTWDSLGTLGVNTYTAEGLLLTSEGKMGDSTRVHRTYDTLGRLVRTHRLRSGGAMLRLDSLEWNSEHRLTRRIDTFGNWTAYQYNAWGSVTSAISSLGDTTISYYTTYTGRPDSTHTSGTAGYSKVTYEATWGNTSLVRAPDGTILRESLYDGYGRQTSTWSRIVVQATSATTQFQWRRQLAFLNLANQSDSTRTERTDNCDAPCSAPSWPAPTDTLLTRTTRSVHSFLGGDSVLAGPGGTEEVRAYDALGRLVYRTLAGSPAETFRYDVAGNLRFRVTRRGYEMETQYDSRNRVTRTLTPTVGTFDYAYGGPSDELTAVTAQAGYADPVGGSNPNLAWTYNQSGQLVSETSQGNRTTTYAYDAYLRDSTYADALGTWRIGYDGVRGTADTLETPHGDRIGYGLDSVGRRRGPAIDGTGTDVTMTQAWLQRGSLSWLRTQVASGYMPGRLWLGREVPDQAYDSLTPLWEEQRGLGQGTISLADSLRFDGWGRVTQVEYLSDGQQAGRQYFAYDRSGNMSLGSDSVPQWTFSATGNRLDSTSSCSYVYDAAGNLQTRTCGAAVTTFAYDALDRLITVAGPGGLAAAYSYDALGQRIAKKVNGVVTRFVWRGGHVQFETDGAGTIQRSYTWGEETDDLRAIHDHQAGGHYYVVQDRLRSVRALVNRAGGAYVGPWRYALYGTELLSAEAPFPLRFRYAGAQYDAETGLYYLRSRYYDPALGRFIQEDPIGHAGGADLYGYAAGNPTSGRDPSGLVKEYVLGSDPHPHTAIACSVWYECAMPEFAGSGGGGGGGGPAGLFDLDRNGTDDALDILIANYPMAHRLSLALIQELAAGETCTSALPCRALTFDEYRTAVLAGVAGIAGAMRGLVGTQLQEGRYLVSDARFSGTSRNAVGTTLQSEGTYLTWSFIRSDAFVPRSTYFPQLPNTLLHEFLHTRGYDECRATFWANHYTTFQVDSPGGCVPR